jgi:hypothetical protein
VQIVALVGMLAVAGVGCDVARAGTRCSPNGKWGRDATYVLQCQNGRWRRTITIAQYAQIVIANLPKPSPTTPPTPPPPPPPPPPLTSFGAGRTPVGATSGRLVPGLYTTTTPVGDVCGWQRLDPNGAVLGDNLFEGMEFVEVKPTDATISATGPCVYTPAPATPVAIPASGDADYRVGIEIQPGWYRTPGGDDCYWEMATRHDGEISGITLNHFGRGPQVVQLQAASSAFESRNCGTWTRLPGQPRPMVSLTGEHGDTILADLDATYTSADGPIDLSGGAFGVEVRVAGWIIDFTPATGQALVAGTYPNAVRAHAGLPGAGLSLEGNGRGCNAVSGSFTIASIQWSPAGEPTSLTASFQQSCDGGPLAYGYIDI